MRQRPAQKWNILIPRLKQIHDSNDPKNILFRATNHWDAFFKLVRVPSFVQWDPPSHQSLNPTVTGSCAVESLPSEILDQIIASQCLSKSDILAFGLSSPALWPNVLQHIGRDCKSSSPPSWAGLEIAKMGNRLGDLPIPFKKDALFARSVGVEDWHKDDYIDNQGLRHWWSTVANSAVDPFDIYDPYCAAQLLFQVARDTWRHVGTSVQADWKAASAHHQVKNTKRCKADLLSVIFSIPPATLRKVWLLRNVTAKKYIRCRFDVETMQAFVETKSLRITIEDALELRFCWPSSLNDPPQSGTGRDLWAGHAFDIVLAEEGMVDIKGESWVDVTEEIVNDARLRLQSLDGGRVHRFRKNENNKDYRLAREGAKDLWFNKK